MIKAEFFYANDRIFAFKIYNHGDPIVCSAVSALCTNTVNSIITFTDENFDCKYEEGSGGLYFHSSFLKKGGKNYEAELFLKSLLMGLKDLQESYPDDLKVGGEM